jgi:hypothetical protein
MTIPTIITESAAYLLTMLIGTVIAVLAWETITKRLIKRLPRRNKTLVICLGGTVALLVFFLLWKTGFFNVYKYNGRIDLHLQECIVTLYCILLIALLALFHTRQLETVKKLKNSIFLFLLLALYSTSVLGIISCRMWEETYNARWFGCYDPNIDYFSKMTEPVETKYSYLPEDGVWAAIFGVLGTIVAVCIGIILWKFQPKGRIKVNLIYQDIKIGSLTHKNKRYIFDVETENQEKAEEMGFPSTFLFGNKKKLESDKLFTFLARFIPDMVRTDLIPKTGILKTDDDFTKLIKSAKLNTRRSEPYIEVKKDRTYFILYIILLAAIGVFCLLRELVYYIPIQ